MRWLLLRWLLLLLLLLPCEACLGKVLCVEEVRGKRTAPPSAGRLLQPLALLLNNKIVAGRQGGKSGCAESYLSSAEAVRAARCSLRCCCCSLAPPPALGSPRSLWVRRSARDCAVRRAGVPTAPTGVDLDPSCLLATAVQKRSGFGEGRVHDQDVNLT